ncbi:hypothetical protein TWF481_000482 [Arthrobotrys musiformis]|uniref:F-box domain-containing protein n=1 Tax=Arthrobotrys musiformis TaxID=47236 RepID=A0AAV9WMW1_9PEZI
MDSRKRSSPLQGINTLPAELHVEILSYLTDSISSQISASKVCRLWESIILTDPYFRSLRYGVLENNDSDLVAVHQLFDPSEVSIPRQHPITKQQNPLAEVRCKIVNEEITACHYVMEKNYHAYSKEYNFGPPPSDCTKEHNVLDITHSAILDEQCIQNVSILPIEEQYWSSDVPRLTAPLEELDILTAIHFRGQHLEDVIFAEPVNFCTPGGLTNRQLLEDVVATLIASMRKKSNLDTKKEHYVYLAMRYVPEGDRKECWFRTVLCHPDVRMSKELRLLNVLGGY